MRRNDLMSFRHLLEPRQIRVVTRWRDDKRSVDDRARVRLVPEADTFAAKIANDGWCAFCLTLGGDHGGGQATRTRCEGVAVPFNKAHAMACTRVRISLPHAGYPGADDHDR
jgi:hypothetical protein